MSAALMDTNSVERYVLRQAFREEFARLMREVLDRFELDDGDEWLAGITRLTCDETVALTDEGLVGSEAKVKPAPLGERVGIRLLPRLHELR